MQEFILPIENFDFKSLPRFPEEGSFWESRGDRFHCGIDFYCEENTPVLSCEDGYVLKTGIFTSQNILYYWDITYFVLIKSLHNDYVLKYAEMKKIFVSENQKIKRGEIIGLVGKVINPDKLSFFSPLYIQRIAASNNCSMLHLELHKFPYKEIKPYLGGNYFGLDKPNSLLNIEKFLIENYK